MARPMSALASGAYFGIILGDWASSLSSPYSDLDKFKCKSKFERKSSLFKHKIVEIRKKKKEKATRRLHYAFASSKLGIIVLISLDCELWINN